MRGAKQSPGAKGGCSAQQQGVNGKGEAGSGETALGGGREGKALGGERRGGWNWDMLGKCGGRASGKAVNPLQLEEGGRGKHQGKEEQAGR